MLIAKALPCVTAGARVMTGPLRPLHFQPESLPDPQSLPRLSSAAEDSAGCRVPDPRS
jgi:hypothetical protein